MAAASRWRGAWGQAAFAAVAATGPANAQGIPLEGFTRVDGIDGDLASAQLVGQHQHQALDAGLVKFRSNVLDLAFTPRPRSLVEQPRRLPETALDRHKRRVVGQLGGARVAARLGGGDRRVQRVAASVGRRARRN